MNTGSGSANQDLTGALPAGLGDLGPALKSLGLDYNAITSLSTELGALTGLTYLYLSNNTITSLPTEIGALTGLQYLDLDNNDLMLVPTEVGALTGLMFLNLFNNKITSVPAELAALTGLETLNLADNLLTGLPPRALPDLGPVGLLRVVREPGLQLRQRRRRDHLLHPTRVPVRPHLRRRPARRAVLHRVTSSSASAPAVAPRPGRGDLARNW